MNVLVETNYCTHLRKVVFYNRIKIPSDVLRISVTFEGQLIKKRGKEPKRCRRLISFSSLSMMSMTIKIVKINDER